MNTEDQRDDPAERAIERDAKELEERLERLEGHLSDAESELAERKRIAGIEEDAAEE